MEREREREKRMTAAKTVVIVIINVHRTPSKPSICLSRAATTTTIACGPIRTPRWGGWLFVFFFFFFSSSQERDIYRTHAPHLRIYLSVLASQRHIGRIVTPGEARYTIVSRDTGSTERQVCNNKCDTRKKSKKKQQERYC